MSIKFYTLIFALCLCSQGLTQTFAERALKAYEDNDKNFDIDCFYNMNKTWKLITPDGDTIKGPDTLSRNFSLKSLNRSIPMSFVLKNTDGRLTYEIVFDKTHTSRAKLSYRYFIVPQITDKKFDDEFEIKKIYCSVNFAEAAPFVLRDGNYHINVHPHLIYDWQNRLKDITENYLKNPDYTSLILLESVNNRGARLNIFDFFNGREPNLPPLNNMESNLENVPEDVPLIVSPAGNNRFDIQAKSHIKVTFTGGNHNYCIWNGTRHVLEGLLNSTSQASVDFIYDTNAIVAQLKGVEKMGLNFPTMDIRRSNLLKDLLANTETQKRYHTNYLDYFSGYLADEYSGMYRTFTLDYEAVGFQKKVTLKGAGSRDLKIKFRYLGEKDK